jgi:predicted metal-dependent hydrolase
MRVPVPLQDYILLHELTHLRHPDHSAAFHAELERLLTDHFAQNAENEDFQAFAKAIKASRARFPIGYTLERSIKAYRPV